MRDLIGQLQIWSKNRPPDFKRVRKIRNIYSEYAPNIIYAWRAENQRLYVYDGSHRWEAVKGQPDSTVWLAIRETTDEIEIEEEFKAMNSAVPVPDLFLQPDSSIKLTIVDFVTSLVKRYKGLSSSSRNPHRPSFNRDTLTDLLYGAMIDETDLDIAKVEKTVLDLNSSYSELTFTDKIKQKCIANDCHLFAVGMQMFVTDLNIRLKLDANGQYA